MEGGEELQTWLVGAPGEECWEESLRLASLPPPTRQRPPNPGLVIRRDPPSGGGWGDGLLAGLAPGPSALKIAWVLSPPLPERRQMVMLWESAGHLGCDLTLFICPTGECTDQNLQAAILSGVQGNGRTCLRVECSEEGGGYVPSPAPTFVAPLHPNPSALGPLPVLHLGLTAPASPLVQHSPAIRIDFRPIDGKEFAQLMEALGGATHLIATSGQAVVALGKALDRLSEGGVQVRLGEKRVYAVGARTAAALKQLAGDGPPIQVTCPRDESAGALATDLARELGQEGSEASPSPVRVVWPRSGISRDELWTVLQSLVASGHVSDLTAPCVYDTLPNTGLQEAYPRGATPPPADVEGLMVHKEIVFTSPSVVASFLDRYGAGSVPWGSHSVVAKGRTTMAALLSAG